MTTLSAPPPFGIVSTYKSLLAADPSLPMPIAAIESLVKALTSSPTNTISETLSLLETYSTALREGIQNPISLSAGTDLFQRYLITSINRPESRDFPTLRNQIVSNGHLYISRAKQAREKIASKGAEVIPNDSTVLTYGGSRVVDALLRRAADPRHDGRSAGKRFKVIYVLPSPSPSHPSSSAPSPEGLETVHALRALGVPVATISTAAVAYALGKVDLVLVGAEAVVKNGGIVSRMGTYQLGLLAQTMRLPLYVVVESYKFVRLFTPNQYELPVEQKVVEFTTAEDEAAEKKGRKNMNGEEDGARREEKTKGYFDHEPADGAPTAVTMTDAVDYTPPKLISALITENGVLTPDAASEEIIKLWYDF